MFFYTNTTATVSVCIFVHQCMYHCVYLHTNTDITVFCTLIQVLLIMFTFADDFRSGEFSGQCYKYPHDPCSSCWHLHVYSYWLCSGRGGLYGILGMILVLNFEVFVVWLGML